MELRPVHTALVAGRAASRWASSASTRAAVSSTTRPSSSTPSLHRHISTTRPSSQEAAAAAAAPAPRPPEMASMAAYAHRLNQRQAEAKQKQGSAALGAPPQSQIGLQSARSILGGPGSSHRRPPPSWAGAAGAAGSRFRDPWQKGSNSIIGESSVDRNIDELGVDDKDPVLFRPERGDLDGQSALQLINERPVDVKYRLHPVIGRTVEVGGQVDIARGLALLSMKCATNKVKLDFNKQRFHERAGMKRKRLRRERWRVRFKEGFKATCSRVRDLAKQGW